MMRASSGGEGKDAEPPLPRTDPDSNASDLAPHAFPADPQELREELRMFRQREREILALLGSSSPQRILHDIRNLLNEVQLLRYLAERND